MNTALSNPKPEFISLAATYNDKRFNSPNDAVYECNIGELFFTDPPYGLSQT
jgi:gluconolactonase